MQKLLIASAIAFTSTSALADHCNVELDGQLSLKDQVLTVTTDDRDTVSIDQHHALYINGSELTLTSEQQEWVSNYYQGINEAAPRVANIAIEGVSIAKEAVSLVFGELLGSRGGAIDNLDAKLSELKEDIQYSFYAADGSVQIDSEHFEDGNLFGDQWQQEFEETIEDVIASSMGRLLIAIGSEMLFSGGDMDAFEARMENFADDIEHQMTVRAEALEEDAEELCLILAEVDFAETQLQKSVDALKSLDIFAVNNYNNAM